MTIKGMDGQSYDVTGNGQGNLNTVLGALGTAGFLGLGGNGFGLLGNNTNNQCSDNQPISRYEANQMIALSAKDAEIANLKADQATDKKLVEVFNAINGKANENRDRIDMLQREMSEKITAEREARLIAEGQQQVFNQQMIGTTSTMSSQIQQLQNVVGQITTNVVPQNKVCNTGCCCGMNQ